jgi:hypothetical protein
LPARPSGKDKLQAKQLSLHKFQFSAQKQPFQLHPENRQRGNPQITKCKTGPNIQTSASVPRPKPPLANTLTRPHQNTVFSPRKRNVLPLSNPLILLPLYLVFSAVTKRLKHQNASRNTHTKIQFVRHREHSVLPLDSSIN